MLKTSHLKFDEALALKAGRETLEPRKLVWIGEKNPGEASHKELHNSKTFYPHVERPLENIGKHRTDKSKLFKLLNDKFGFGKERVIKDLDKNITERGSGVKFGHRKGAQITGDSFGKKGRWI